VSASMQQGFMESSRSMPPVLENAGLGGCRRAGRIVDDVPANTSAGRMGHVHLEMPPEGQDSD